MIIIPVIAALSVLVHSVSDRGDWFKSLKMPGSGSSCCDVADCAQTKAEWREGQWWAVVRETWTPVPPDRVLKSPHSLDGEAYLCSNPGLAPNGVVNPLVIYCFVPPDMGY